MWFYCINKETDQCNKTKSSETDPSLHGKLADDKLTSQINGGSTKEKMDFLFFSSPQGLPVHSCIFWL